jgi:nucleoside transporter
MAHGQSQAVSGSIPPLGMGLRINLSVMMFLQFAIWGAWFVVLGNYIYDMGFERAEIGRVYATMSLGAILSPIFVGQIADRYFSSERLMALLHLAGGGLLFWLAQITEPAPFYWVALLYALIYSPTLVLSNSIAFSHIPSATRDFPSVRVLGTIGWIAVGIFVTLLLGEFANRPDVQGLPAPKYSMIIGESRFTLPLLLAGGLSVLLGLWSFFLPHTPPKGVAGDALPFLKAVGLMKEFSFAVFYGVSFIITIVLAFYYSFTPVYLEHAQGVPPAAISSVMTIGQICEMVLLPILPFFLARFGMKWVLALGMFAWGVRYAMFAYAHPEGYLVYVPLASISESLPNIYVNGWVLVGIALHGICFDFFFAAGFIHVDNKAPRDIRASGQALFGFLTYGLGMYIGSELSGHVNQYFTRDQVTDWMSFWMVPAIGVFISFAAFVLLFWERSPAAKPGEGT